MTKYEWPFLLEEVPQHGEFHSPLMLCQEAVGGDMHYGWRVIVASMFCSRTHRSQSHQGLWRFLARWPYPESVAFAQPSTKRRMAQLIKPCGFQNKRVEDLVTMSKNWIMGLRPPEIHGAGEYVTDAYRIFVLKETNFAPQDKELTRYLSWTMIESARMSRAGTRE